MKIIIHGAGKEVGRSAIELQTKEKRFLFDCGIKIEGNKIVTPSIPNKINEINALLLSHAHLDHTGALPIFHAKGMDCPVYATEMTKDIGRILLFDSWKIEMINDRSPVYKRSHITSILGNFTLIQLNHRYKRDGFAITYFDAGHIPGSTSILLEADQKKILYSGDINHSDTYLLKGAAYEDQLKKVDLLITESTYGNRDHPDRNNEEEEFFKEILGTIKNGGSVIIPTFAVGRAQEIILMIQKIKISVPVYLDGMAVKITNKYLEHYSYIRDFDALEKAVANTHLIKKKAQRKDIIDNQAIFITTSGMLDGGPVVEYLKVLGENPKNSILLTGYQVETSNGHRLLNQGEVLLDNQIHKIAAKARKFDFSAHSGQKEIINYITKINPKQVLLIHGDEDSTNELSCIIASKGIDVIIGSNDEPINII